jgi:hypothetical protein
MTTEYGSDVEVTHGGSVYVCRMCKKEITVVAEIRQSYPVHFANCMHVACLHCLEIHIISDTNKCLYPNCDSKQTSKICTIACSMMMLNEEYILLTEDIIPDLRNQISTDKGIIEILMLRMNKTISLLETTSLRKTRLTDLCADTHIQPHITKYGVITEIEYNKNKVIPELMHDLEILKYHETKNKKNEKLLEDLKKRTTSIQNGIGYMVNQYKNPPIFTKKSPIHGLHLDKPIDIPSTLYLEEINAKARLHIADHEKTQARLHIEDKEKTQAIQDYQEHMKTPGWVLDCQSWNDEYT